MLGSKRWREVIRNRLYGGGSQFIGRGKLELQCADYMHTGELSQQAVAEALSLV